MLELLQPAVHSVGLVGTAMPEQAERTEEDWVRRVDKRTNVVKAIKRTETYARALLGCSYVPLSTHPEKDAFWPGAGVEMS